MDEVTATEAAQLTGLSERTIRRKIISGEIPARHVAKNRYAIRVRDLPARERPTNLQARVEALEHRVRLLELTLSGAPQEGPQQQATRSVQLAPAAPHAPGGAGVSLAHEAPSSSELNPILVAALHDALSQVIAETTRLARPRDLNPLPASADAASGS